MQFAKREVKLSSYVLHIAAIGKAFREPFRAIVSLSLIAMVILHQLSVVEGNTDITISTLTSSSTTGVIVKGSSEDDFLGYSVSEAGDVNGDGIGDVIIGAPYDDQNSLTNPGMAFVLFGKQPGGSFSTLLIGDFSSGVDGFRIIGDSDEGLLGYSVSAAGDFNADGFDDVIVGAPYAGAGTTGMAYVIFGHSMATTFEDVVVNVWTTWGTTGMKIKGPVGSSMFGCAVSKAGDFNKDGIADIIVGALSASVNSLSLNGFAVVLFGHRNDTTFPEVDTASFLSGTSATGFRITGGTNEERLGRTVGCAGDVNGDGFGDIIIGSTDVDAFDQTNCGAAFVIFGHGAPYGPVSTGSIGVLGFVIFGAATGDLLGSSVSGAGDFNGDGYADVIVGAKDADYSSRSDCGFAYIIYGHSNSTIFSNVICSSLSSSVGFSMHSSTALSRFGASVKYAGDINKDGYGDVIIGSPRILGASSPGIAYVVYGKATNADLDMDLFASGSGGFRVLGANLNTYVGASVSAAGDWNGDGMNDIIVGAYAESVITAGDEGGQAYIIFSQSMPSQSPTSQPSARPSRQPSTQPSSIPSVQPSSQPTSQPQLAPTSLPSAQPSGQPSNQPVGRPSSRPSVQPSSQPTRQPSSRPSVPPSRQPSSRPTRQPSSQPSAQPSQQPSSIPSAQPSARPTNQPSGQPTWQPSSQPSGQPTRCPSAQPSAQPRSRPTSQPSSRPSAGPSAEPSQQPSSQPSAQPSVQPSHQPTNQPSSQPSARPSTQPSGQPSHQPSQQPNSSPTSQPSEQPSCRPSAQPSRQPSGQPSAEPSRQPSSQPSSQPSRLPSMQPSAHPTGQPSHQPSSRPSCQPSCQPSGQPSVRPTSQPSQQPSGRPSGQPSNVPTGQPSVTPTAKPSSQPSQQPSAAPSSQPSVQPSSNPSRQPSGQPTHQPSQQPKSSPTSQPSDQPSYRPSAQPSRQPSGQPSAQPSLHPSRQPSGQPSMQPTRQPTVQPSVQPTAQPSRAPSSKPTRRPSGQPTGQPSSGPTQQPLSQPTGQPTTQPSVYPSTQPSDAPSKQPSSQPSGKPTGQPTAQPSSQPSGCPSCRPSGQPSCMPTLQPSTQPVALPSSQPSKLPSGQPSAMPSTQPTVQPSQQPQGMPSLNPSSQPSSEPSAQPSLVPSDQPTTSPTTQPSGAPTTQPSAMPTTQPAGPPSAQPTGVPTKQPSTVPSSQPTAVPSVSPSVKPSMQPSSAPSAAPSGDPTGVPSGCPTVQPTGAPSAVPTHHPSAQPNSEPTGQPSHQWSECPSSSPSTCPSAAPSSMPTSQPSAQPSQAPSAQRIAAPTATPASQPTSRPSIAPTAQPLSHPTTQPNALPSALPSNETPLASSGQPSGQPSRQPSGQPTAQPIALPSYDSGAAVDFNISVHVVSTARTAVELGVLISEGVEGFVYCAALAGENARLLSSAILFSSSAGTSVLPDQLARVNITGLIPATDYTIYCTVENLAGIELPWADVLRTQQQTRTGCCREVLVETLKSAVFIGSAAAQPLRITVPALPTEPMLIQLSTTSEALAFHPATLTLTNTTNLVAITNTVFLTASAAATTEVLVTLSGSSALQYTVVYLGSRNIKAIASSDEPVAPSVQRAEFSEDGTFVTITFDSPTDRASLVNSFPCTTLLVFAGATSAVCLWSTDATIRVYPRYSPQPQVTVIGVNSTLTVLGSKIRAQCPSSVALTACGGWTAVALTQVRILPPFSPVNPGVVLVAPSTLGACASLTLDLSGSVGAAGRPWTSVIFQVRTGSGASIAALQLERYLQRNYTISPPTTVPPAAFAKDLTYRIQVTLCNFLGACGSAARSVTALASPQSLPVVSILGGPIRAAFRSDILGVTAEAFTEACDSTKSYNNLQFQWSLMVRMPGQSTFLAVPSLRSTSQNPAVFKLPAYTLFVGAEYQLFLSVTSAVSLLSSKAAVSVTVAAGNIIAELAGGSRRYAIVGDVLTLDASRSYDSDYPDLVGPSAQLQFAWSCVRTAPTFSAICPVIITAGVYGHASATAPVGSLYTTALISLLVSDGVRSSTAQTEIVTSSAPAPKLAISNGAASLVGVDTGKQLALLGSLSLLAPCTARWSVDDSSIRLQEASRTPTVQRLLPPASGTAVPFNLVIVPGGLPQRAALMFTLGCGNVTTSVTVTTNGSPLPGLFTIDPPSGSELGTLFVFAAEQWADPDLPLMYEFGFLSATSLANLVIVSKSELSSTLSTLPAGTEQASYTLKLLLHVYDALGSAAEAKSSAVVLPVSSIERDATLTELLLSGSGSIDETKRILSVVSTALNSANCSAAANCTEQNRSPCVKTTGQCGPCLPGYVGDRGDRNTLCMPAYALKNVTAQGCQRDSDCSYWQQCIVSTRECVDLSKSCARNCSGHGECLFVDRAYGTHMPSCLLGDLLCDAVCACEDDYSGEFCEIDSNTLQRHREIRSNLIGSLSNLTRQEDINPESIASWSASLYSLSIRPHDLSVNDVRAVTAIANTTLTNALSLGVQKYQDIVGVLQATDAVASLLKYNYNPNDYNDPQFTVVRDFLNNTAAEVIPVVRSFGDLVSGAQVLGEPRTDLLYDNFRLSTVLASTGDGVTIPAPQSMIESSLGEHPSEVSLQASGDTVMSIKMVLMQPRAYTDSTAAFVSTPVALQIENHDKNDESAVQSLSDIEFTFQHNDPQDHYVNYTSANLTTTCTERNASQQFSFVCPDSGHVLRHNCSRGAGVQTSYCPRPASACARVDYLSAGISLPSTCRVTDYNATCTICSCDVSSAGRRLSAQSVEKSILDESGATDMMVSTVFIASNFADTFKSADELNSPAAVAQVIVVIAMLGSLWVPALLFMGFDWLKPAVAKTAKDGRAALDAKAKVLRYVRTIIPSVYTTDMSLTARLWDEIAQHHTLFSLFTSSSAHKRRETICKMLTVLTFMLFLTAVFFDVSNPGDDGTCVNYATQDDCLHRVSPFDGDRAFCQWTADSTCAYNSERMSMKALFYLTVLTTVLTSIATVPVDYCFQILSAPTAQSLKGSTVMNAVSAMVDGARRISNVGINAVARRMTAVVAPVTPVTSSVSNSRSVTLLGMSLGKKDAIIANRELSEEFQEFAEEARLELNAMTGEVRAVILREELQRTQRRAKSVRMISSARSNDKTTDPADSGAMRGAELTTPPPALLADVLLQRLQMNDVAEETRIFDQQWGVARRGWEAQQCYLLPASEQAIAAEIESVEAEATKLSKALPNFSVQHAGLEILHLFMVDLLGRNTVAAKIFREKFSEEFGDSQVVQMAQKYAAGTLLVCLNAFFMYFILLKGIEKGQAWQLQYLVCSIFQVVIDVLVFETTECIWLNFAVPRVVDAEVVTAAATLTALAEKVVLPVPQRDLKSGYFLNAAAQLFVSVRLAKAHPQLLESLIVGCYSSPLPGEICKTWPHYKLAEEQREVAVTKSVFPRSFLRGLTLATQVCLTIPYVYQRVILRFAQPVIFSAISVVWFLAIQNTASIAALCAVSAVGAGYWYWRRYQGQQVALQRQASILPVATAVALVSSAMPTTPISPFLVGFGDAEEDGFVGSHPPSTLDSHSETNRSSTCHSGSRRNASAAESPLHESMDSRHSYLPNDALSQDVDSGTSSSQSAEWSFGLGDEDSGEVSGGTSDRDGGDGEAESAHTADHGTWLTDADADEKSADGDKDGDSSSSHEQPAEHEPASYFSGSEWGDEEEDDSQWGSAQEVDYWDGSRQWEDTVGSDRGGSHSDY